MQKIEGGMTGVMNKPGCMVAAGILSDPGCQAAAGKKWFLVARQRHGY